MASSRPAKRRKLRPFPENPISPKNSISLTNYCFTESTQSSDLTKEVTRIADLEEENSTCGTDWRDTNPCSARREKMAESGEMKSTAKLPAEEKSPAATKMVSEAELEEFFSTAEKQIHKQFADKYNFDVAKELPLEGRYEWFQIKP